MGTHLRNGVITLGVAAALMAQTSDADKGKTVFGTRCSVCHNADSIAKKLGPGLKGLFKKTKLASGKQPTEANVRTVIDAGGGGMPEFKDMLSTAEKDSLVAYLKTL